MLQRPASCFSGLRTDNQSAKRIKKGQHCVETESDPSCTWVQTATDADVDNPKFQSPPVDLNALKATIDTCETGIGYALEYVHTNHPHRT